MAGETVITVVGNLTADPELRFTPSGAAVASFTIASTPRTFDRNSNEWKDGEALFLRCSIWRQAAENAAESLSRGMRVIASGRLKQRSFETREGEKRTVIELDVDEIGPSLEYASAKVNRTQRGSSSAGFGASGAVRPAPVPPGRAAPVTTPGVRLRRRAAAARASPKSRPSNPPSMIALVIADIASRSRSIHSGDDRHAEATHSQAEEEAESAARGEDRPTSTTRTPRCCESSCPTAARSEPAASPA